MRFRFFLRGLGFGILLASCVFYFSGGSEKPAQMSDEEIMQRARELGMEEKQDPVRELLASREEDSEEQNPVSAQDILEEQKRKEMLQESDDTRELAEQTEILSSSEESAEGQTATVDLTKTVNSTETADSEKKKDASEKDQKLTDEEAQKQSKKDRLSEEATTNKSSEQDLSEQPNTVTSKEVPDKSDTEKQTAEDQQAVESDTVSIKIKGGTSSMIICQKLQKAGIIDDAAEFDEYLIKNGYSKRLRSGTYNLKKGMDFQEIAKSISR